MKSNKLALAIAGVMGMGAFTVLPSAALAQKAAETIEEVVVTGSRIRRAD